jgi:putative photosynthetic complex assembly protein 2
MGDILAPVLTAIVAWFVSTGAIVWLDRRPRAAWAMSLHMVSLLAIAAGVTAWSVADQTSAWAAYHGFMCALILWGWHELAFLMGYITGPRRTPMPPGATGFARFKAATATVIHHEIAIVATLIALAALTWGQPNQTATLTFAALTVLRLSAKFNIFLGVPGLDPQMMPEHLAYLASYFRTRPGNALLPVSLAGALVAAVLAVQQGLAAPAGSGAATGWLLVGTLIGLGLLEHLFLVLPVKDGRLFAWAMGGEAAHPAAARPSGAGADPSGEHFREAVRQAGTGTQCPFPHLPSPVLPSLKSD